MVNQRDFEDILPLLAATYMRGKLVPFIGAGMSVPRLALWKEFVRQLEDEAGIRSPDDDKGNDLDVRAQRACAKLQNSRGPACFLKSLSNALTGTSDCVPPQTTRLASIRWPLVVSTNYDDLYYGSCRSAQGPTSDIGVEVVGRAPKDCKMVLAALHGPFDRQYIWHVQGFLGGQFGGGVENSVPDLDSLRTQLVVGHAQYRLVTNASPHFRRCFGEMFSSRSFLFLGSSLSEQYFLNLFGEVLELRGPSSTPHFAFTRKGQVNAHFLADQMNITVCEFEEFEELTSWLEILKRAIEYPIVHNTHWSFALRPSAEVGWDLEITRAEVSVRPGPDVAIAFAVRRDGEDRPILPEKYSFLSRECPEPHNTGYHLSKFGEQQVYAVTARCKGNEDDTAVSQAVHELFDAVDKANKEQEQRNSVHLQLFSSAGTVPSVYAFMEVVRAFGEWRRMHPKSRLRLILHIQLDVAFNLTSERIDVQELLSSELLRFWVVVVSDPNQEPVRRILHYKKDCFLRDVLEELEVPSLQGPSEWTISICPTPRRETEGSETERRTWKLRDCTLQSIGLVFGSILTLECANANCAMTNA